MCGRYSLDRIPTLQERYGLMGTPLEESFTGHFNVAPGYRMPVVRIADGQRTIELMRWGLVPSWARDPKIGYRTINARSETAAEKPTFRRPLRTQRALIPANAFFEWASTPGGKLPYKIDVAEEETFSMAGLWDSWADPQGITHHSYTILTTSPNELMLPIHDRMPVILAREDEGRWLDPDLKEPAQLARFLIPYPAEKMRAVPISSLVNNPSNDTPKILEPLDPQEELVA